MKDLSEFNQPLTETLLSEKTDEFSFSETQFNFFHENGYPADVKILNEKQIEILRAELVELMKPAQAGNPLLYKNK